MAWVMRKSLLQALLPPLIAVLFLAVVILLGKAAHEALRGGDRASIAFADIDCPPPPGQERADFLGEVQYLGGLPERVNVLDDGLAERLAGAFAKHPWVEKVQRVQVMPPKKVRVQVVYRTPVLAVYRWHTPEERKTLYKVQPGGLGHVQLPEWVVDGQSILLPATAPQEGLPTLYAKIPPPSGSSGTAWGDVTVLAAAKTGNYLRPYRERLQLTGYAIDVNDSVLLLSVYPEGRLIAQVIWGHAPGDEQPDEPSAAEKLQRLLDYCDQHGGLGGEQEPVEHDVRPRDQAIHRPLPRQPFSGGS
jgi:hypothetical protein